MQLNKYIDETDGYIHKSHILRQNTSYNLPEHGAEVMHKNGKTTLSLSASAAHHGRLFRVTKIKMMLVKLSFSVLQ